MMVFRWISGSSAAPSTATRQLGRLTGQGSGDAHRNSSRRGDEGKATGRGSSAATERESPRRHPVSGFSPPLPLPRPRRLDPLPASASVGVRVKVDGRKPEAMVLGAGGSGDGGRIVLVGNKFRCLKDDAEELFLKPVKLADMKKLKSHLLRRKQPQP